MNPRIVILSAFLSPLRSGAEACAEEVPLQLSQEFDFTIITARMRGDLPKRDLVQGTIPVIRVGLGCSFDKWLYPFLASLEARKHNPNIVHGILETFAGLALHLCSYTCPRAKRILTLQTTNRSFLKGFVVQSPHHVTAISKALAGIAAKLGRNDVIVIPNGIDYATIRLICEAHSKIPGRMLFVGRLEPMKGVDVLLAALAKLTMENARLPDGQEQLQMSLHIVGDGSQRQLLEKLAQQLGISDRVRFLGRLPAPKVYREYAEAEIFCGLSRSEALGNVFLEAQAAGCAVIATNVHGIPEIIEHEVSGILVDKDDADAAGRAIVDLFKDKARRKRFADAGIERAKHFDWSVIAEKYKKIYIDVVK